MGKWLRAHRRRRAGFAATKSAKCVSLAKGHRRADLDRLKAIIDPVAGCPTNEVLEALHSLRDRGRLPTKILRETLIGEMIDQLAEESQDCSIRGIAKQLVVEWSWPQRKRKAEEVCSSRPRRRLSSQSLDGDSVVLDVLDGRWECDLCFSEYGESERPWRLDDYGERCCHVFCKRCVLGCLQLEGCCPYDKTEFPQKVVCGVMLTAQFVDHEKKKAAQRTGGIICSDPQCPGIAPSADVLPPRPVQCAKCSVRHCGRRVCGAPWADGHRCWDVIERERELERQRASERERAEVREWEERLRARAAGSVEGYVPFAGQDTVQRLREGPRFQSCPKCGVMVEHDGGCNMVFHASCKTRWCFVCCSVGVCSDYDCRHLEALP